MDRDAKLSFIPKKPLARSDFLQSRPLSLFLTLSFSLLVITAATYGGLYFYTDALKKGISDKKATLEDTRKKFDLSIIEKAKAFKTQIETAQGLIDGHIALSSLFDFLGAATLKSVGYDTFQYLNKDGKTEISLDGKAPNYASVALQRDALLLEVEKKNLASVSVGNYKLDENGNVVFGWRASFSPTAFLYKNTVAPAAPVSSGGTVLEVTTPSVEEN